MSSLHRAQQRISDRPRARRRPFEARSLTGTAAVTAGIPRRPARSMHRSPSRQVAMDEAERPATARGQLEHPAGDLPGDATRRAEKSHIISPWV